MKVHWAPPLIPNIVLSDLLSNYGTVVSMAFEKCVGKGFEGVATGVRSVVISGNKNDLPHTLNVTCPKTGHKFKFLFSIRSRKPLCLRCHQMAHFRCEGGSDSREDFRKGLESIIGPVSLHVLSFGPAEQG